jgi:hypothetical protein
VELTSGKESKVMKDKTVWTPLKDTTPDEFKGWLNEMEYEPYTHDPLLQSVSWVKDLTKAIKKVAPIVGEGNRLEYRYWGYLQPWEFILNCLSIARAFGNFNFSPKKFGWKVAVENLKFWVDGMPSDPRTRNLYLSSASFFYDMVRFFNDNRKLTDPRKLAREVNESE